jgi:hypothetical protein
MAGHALRTQPAFTVPDAWEGIAFHLGRPCPVEATGRTLHLHPRHAARPRRRLNHLRAATLDVEYSEGSPYLAVR